jgi:poly-gamma-glutamate capsule biosynthesis protein CapA/YwtB (metallophosphatase superfamily)
MNFDDFNNAKPSLTEPGVKYFLNQALKQSHIIREKFHNVIFNVGLLIFFLLILGLILFYKYKGRLSPVEMAQKNKEKQQYILDRIKNFQIAKQKAHQELITGLPHWEDEYNILHSRPGF